MAVTFELSKDKKKIIITADLESAPFELSGSHRTFKVVGGGAPMKTGVKVKDNKGDEREITIGLNGYIKNPDFKDPAKEGKDKK